MFCSGFWLWVFLCQPAFNSAPKELVLPCVSALLCKVINKLCIPGVFCNMGHSLPPQPPILMSSPFPPLVPKCPWDQRTQHSSLPAPRPDPKSLRPPIALGQKTMVCLLNLFQRASHSISQTAKQLCLCFAWKGNPSPHCNLTISI